jgi:conjugative relaxase-like TrwC/TraI family protein
VISIAMLSGGAARATYYVERAAECHPSGYYLDDAEPAGRWCGHGAGALGLARSIDRPRAAVFAGLLDGRLPDGTHAAGPVMRRNPDDPDGPKIDIRRCGLDVVVSAPKSVSVLFALADPAVSAVVVAAHERAVDEALGYLERHAGHGVRGHQGGGQRAERIDTTGLIAAAFTHRTSRADDPQLHTHVVVANLLHGVDGKWSAVDSRAMHRHARTAGCIYQAVLRGELTAALGVGWGPVRRGVAEITGIPAALRKGFSTRRKAIEAELDRTGAGGRKAAQRAAYVTRPAKTHQQPTSLRDCWRRRAEQLGHEPGQVVARTLRKVKSRLWPAVELLAAELFGPDGLTAKATSFDRRDVIQALTETLPTGVAVTAQQFEAAADRLLTDDAAIPLLNPAARDGDRRWTTDELLVTEQQLIEISGHTTCVPSLTATDAAAAASRHRLSVEQAAVVANLLTSTRLIDVVVGPAGSGKTAALRAAAHGWQSSGVPVIGCALAAITARRLEAATAVPCGSVTRTLADIDRIDPATGQPAGLAPNSVVLVDEASMVGTRHYARLAHHVEAAGGKLVLVGDPAQLAEVDAGGVFGALIRRGEPLSLTGNQRQTNDWERTALTALRAGEADTALAEYVAHGRVHIHGTPMTVRQHLAVDYLVHRNRSTDPYSVVALAPTRRDVARLNDAIRDQLAYAGHLGPQIAVVQGEDHDRRYAIGDIVIVTRNNPRRGLLNGTRATVVGGNAHTLALRTETGRRTTVPTAWAADHLDHGYAMTVHKAQGLTADVALLYGAAALCHQAGYVALSRGRQANHLYAPLSTLQPDHAGLRTSPSGRTTAEPAEVTRVLAERFSRDWRHTLAIDQQPTDPRRGVAIGPEEPPHRWCAHNDDRSTGRTR